MISLLLALLVFLVPSNLFLKLFPETAYVRGLQIDYLIPRISIQMIVVIALVTLFAQRVGVRHIVAELRAALIRKKVLFLLLLALFVRQFFARYPVIAVETYVEWALLGLLVWLSQLKKIKPLFAQFFTGQYFLWSLVATLLFQSTLAIFQFVTQRSLAGYWFLGEGNMQTFAGLSKVELFGRLWTAPLGTTVHPNVLGGVLAVYVLLLWWIARKQKTSLWQNVCISTTVVLAIIALYLAQSMAAWLCLAVGIVMATFKLPKRPLVFLIVTSMLLAPFLISIAAKQWPANDSLVRRAYLNQAAWKMWVDHPLVGVGMQNSTAFVEEYSSVREVARFTQPAHHGGLVAISESGVLGLAILSLLVAQFKIMVAQKSRSLFAVLLLIPLLLIDHFVVTLISGKILLLVAMLYSVTSTPTLRAVE